MVTKPASDDRRVRRTRRQLREALVALTLTKGWDAVSVLDVCDAADIGRSTFYSHFADKENLLLSAFDDLHAAMHHTRQRATEPFAFAEALFAHAAENVDLYRAVAGRQSGQQMLWRFTDVVTSLVAAEVAALKPPKPQQAATTHFVTGGLMALLRDWLDGARPASPAQLAEAFRRLALGATRAVL